MKNSGVFLRKYITILATSHWQNHLKKFPGHKQGKNRDQQETTPLCVRVIEKERECQ